MNKDNKFILIVVIVILFDQITKLLIENFWTKPITIINGVFTINFLKNTGAGFSILQNQNVFLIFIALIIIGIILWNYEQIEKEVHPWFALLIGGALGNLIDRIRVGHVIDFFDFQVWPVFNIADCAITISGIFIIIFYLRQKDD